MDSEKTECMTPKSVWLVKFRSASQIDLRDEGVLSYESTSRSAKKKKQIWRDLFCCSKGDSNVDGDVVARGGEVPADVAEELLGGGGGGGGGGANGGVWRRGWRRRSCDEGGRIPD